VKQKTAIWVAIAAVIGLAFRLWEAYESSLWLDELHSIAHASPPTFQGVLEHTHWDFHVPLFFLVLHPIWRHVSAEALRIVPIAANLLVLAPLLVFAARSRLGAAAAPVLALSFALLPFEIQYATELRPYAFLMLASATACCAAFTSACSPRTRFLLFAAAVAFGIHSHYLMAFTVLMIGVTRLVFLLPALRDRFPARGQLLGLGWLILAGAAGAATLLPWVFGYMFWAVESPAELVPTAAAEQDVTTAHRLDLLQAPVKTLVPVLRSLGAPWAAVATAGTAILVAAIAIGMACWALARLRGRLPPVNRSTALVLTFAFFSILILVMSIWGWSRVSIRYVCISAWLWPLVFCEILVAVTPGWRRSTLAAAMLIGAGLAAVGHCAGKTHEDVRGAVLAALRLGDEIARRDGAPPYYTALLSQPPRFEHGTPYLAYAKDVPFVELKDAVHAGPKPPLLPRRGEPGFERSVVVITRRYLDLDRRAALERARRDQMPEIPRLCEGRRVVTKERLDETMSVWVFEPSP
jgi:hypothetical protein